MSKKSGNVHVSKAPGGSGWKTSQDGKVQSNHRTQGAAIDRGRSEAKRDSVDLVIHGRDGKIRSKDSYGNETSTRDTEH